MAISPTPILVDAQLSAPMQIREEQATPHRKASAWIQSLDLLAMQQWC